MGCLCHSGGCMCIYAKLVCPLKVIGFENWSFKHVEIGRDVCCASTLEDPCRRLCSSVFTTCTGLGVGGGQCFKMVSIQYMVHVCCMITFHIWYKTRHTRSMLHQTLRSYQRWSSSVAVAHWCEAFAAGGTSRFLKIQLHTISKTCLQVMQHDPNPRFRRCFCKTVHWIQWYAKHWSHTLTLITFW